MAAKAADREFTGSALRKPKLQLTTYHVLATTYHLLPATYYLSNNIFNRLIDQSIINGAWLMAHGTRMTVGAGRGWLGGVAAALGCGRGPAILEPQTSITITTPLIPQTERSG